MQLLGFEHLKSTRLNRAQRLRNKCISIHANNPLFFKGKENNKENSKI